MWLWIHKTHIHIYYVRSSIRIIKIDTLSGHMYFYTRRAQQQQQQSHHKFEKFEIQKKITIFPRVMACDNRIVYYLPPELLLSTVHAVSALVGIHTHCIERERERERFLNIFSIFVRILEIFNYLSYIHRLYWGSQSVR